MNRVFVYGTLKRGQRNFHYLEEAQFVGEFTTEAAYSIYLIDDYPAVCLDGGQAVQGEVYLVDDVQLRSLDRLEWYPEYYQRIEIETDYGLAWIYIVKYELCHGRPLLPGSWG